MARLIGRHAVLCHLSQQMRPEGWREPGLGCVLRPFLGATRIGAAFIARATAFVEPLAAVFIAEHMRGSFDAHATLTASAAPRSFYNRELSGMVVNRRKDLPGPQLSLGLSGVGAKLPMVSWASCRCMSIICC